MNDNNAIATNTRCLRQHRAWTQEQLAQAAGCDPRTVQRVEKGETVSDETLQGIAGAFNVDVELLRTDMLAKLAELIGVTKEELTPELLARKQQEVEDNFIRVPARVVHSSAELRPVWTACGMAFECYADDDAVQDAAAGLKRYLGDLLLLGSDADPVHQRVYEKEAFEYVEALRVLGCVVSVGVGHHGVRWHDGTSTPWSTLFVAVARTADARPFFAMETNIAVAFE